MLKIAVCDDEKYWLDIMSKLMKRYEEETGEEVKCMFFESAFQLLDEAEKTPFDGIFLDVRMPHISGADAAKEIRTRDKKVKIIFISSVLDAVFTGYEIGATQYLRKPLTYEKVKPEMDKILAATRTDWEDGVILSTRSGWMRIKISDIRYAETAGRCLLLHCREGEILTRERMRSVGKKLPEESFYQIYISYLVNLDFVRSFRTDGNLYEVELITGEKLPMSKDRKQGFIEAYKKYMRKETE